MLEIYLKYNELTRKAHNILHGKDSHADIAAVMQERQALFKKIEDSGWQDSEKAAVILKDTLQLERECIKILSAQRESLKKEMNNLKAQKHAINMYAGVQ